MCHEDVSNWLEVMVVEMESQRKAGTFVEVLKPKDRNILDLCWVFLHRKL
jgi:hypothetical protein